VDNGGNPYADSMLCAKQRRRVFDKNTALHELVWHRDSLDRKITVESGSGWQLQMDNQLPVDLTPGMRLHISAAEYHRLLRSNICSDLVLMIDENAS